MIPRYTPAAIISRSEEAFSYALTCYRRRRVNSLRRERYFTVSKAAIAECLTATTAAR